MRVGKYIKMLVHLPPSMDDSHSKKKTFLRITAVDEEKYRVAWVLSSSGLFAIPRWLLRAERWQAVSSVDGKTLYESREVFYGPLAHVVRWYAGSKLEEAFKATGLSLKTQAEKQT